MVNIGVAHFYFPNEIESGQLDLLNYSNPTNWRRSSHSGLIKKKRRK